MEKINAQNAEVKSVSSRLAHAEHLLAKHVNPYHQIFLEKKYEMCLDVQSKIALETEPCIKKMHPQRVAT